MYNMQFIKLKELKNEKYYFCCYGSNDTFIWLQQTRSKDKRVLRSTFRRSTGKSWGVQEIGEIQ